MLTVYYSRNKGENKKSAYNIILNLQNDIFMLAVCHLSYIGKLSYITCINWKNQDKQCSLIIKSYIENYDREGFEAWLILKDLNGS